MKDFLTPLLRKKPDKLILHIGADNLQEESPNKTANDIIRLAERVRDSGVRSTVSLITYRDDDLSIKADVVNNIIKSEVRRRSGISIIGHPNISERHLNGSKLHLNRTGTGALAHNLITHIHTQRLW